MKKFIKFFLIILFCVSCKEQNNLTSSSEENWMSLFNGKDLSDWDIKFSGHKLNDNYKNTFQVEDGMIRVVYDGYERFDDKYGHMYYEKPFSYYKIRFDYRFLGEQIPGGESWNVRNSGIMLHCQDPNTMLIDQEFPVSAEMQLLGGLGDRERSTANICTPGTDVDIDGQIAQYHCINSNSLTYNEDEWVNVEVIVYSDSIIHHIVESDTVLSYTNIRVGGGEIPDNYVNRIGEKLSDGFISLQSEGHPVEFKDIKIRELK